MDRQPYRRTCLALAAILLHCVDVTDVGAAEASPYKSDRSLAGTLSIWGPAHMSGVTRNWVAGFNKVQPGVRVDVNLMGSDTAIPGLYSGQADFALLGRENNITDDNGFSRPMGYMPLRFELMTGSLDIPGKTPALVAFVHRDNPLSKITLAQLDAVFGHEHRRGLPNIRTWGELGLGGEWADEPIRLFGFDISTGTGRYFARSVLGDSRKLNWQNLTEFKDVRRADGSIYRAAEQILDALQQEPFGMAISCLCYERSYTKDLALAEDEGGPYVRATHESLTTREYPLARSTYAFIDRPPGTEIDPRILEFLRYIFSQEGRADILREGDYLPLNASVLAEQLAQIE